jgi:hypothetical protein
MIDYRPKESKKLYEYSSDPAEKKAWLEYSTLRRETLDRETNWVLLHPEEIAIPTEDAEAIGKLEKPCPLCSPEHDFKADRQPGYIYPEYLGKTTGVALCRTEMCPCIDLRVFFRKWRNYVPVHDQHIKLFTLRVPHYYGFTSPLVHLCRIEAAINFSSTFFEYCIDRSFLRRKLRIRQKEVPLAHAVLT